MGQEFDSEWHALVDEKLQAGDARMGRMETSLAENTRSTKAVEANTKELIDLLDSFKGAFKVLEGFGRFAKPMSYIFAMCAAAASVWAALKSAGVGFFK